MGSLKKHLASFGIVQRLRLQSIEKFWRLNEKTQGGTVQDQVL